MKKTENEQTKFYKKFCKYNASIDNIVLKIHQDYYKVSSKIHEAADGTILTLEDRKNVTHLKKQEIVDTSLNQIEDLWKQIFGDASKIYSDDIELNKFFFSNLDFLKLVEDLNSKKLFDKLCNMGINFYEISEDTNDSILHILAEKSIMSDVGKMIISKLSENDQPEEITKKFINLENDEKESALIKAFKNNNYGLFVDLRVHFDANTEVTDAFGNTLLHLVIHKNIPKTLFKILIQHGANFDLKNHKGISVKQIAQNLDDQEFYNIINQFELNKSVTYSLEGQKEILVACSLEQKKEILASCSLEEQKWLKEILAACSLEEQKEISEVQLFAENQDQDDANIDN